MNQPKQKTVSEDKPKQKLSLPTEDPKDSENFENEDLEEEEEENDEDLVNENFESLPSSTEIEGVDETENDNYAPNIETFVDSEVAPEVVNQLISESNRKSVPLNSPLLQAQSEGVNKFAPNDAQKHSGASLDAAFERPVADTTNTDVIDLQKNNVKNYNAKDYLPKELNDDWFNTDFSQAKYKMNDDKLINTDKYIIGINTVGQSLKNASYDIRGAVNVPKYSVSPWNNSTIEPDYNIKPLC